MLVRPPIIDDLITILSDWVAGLTSPKPVAAYLFGSTVNEDGVRFDPATGDLDVVMLLDWDGLPQVDRINQLNALGRAKEELESRLFRVLHREEGAKQVVSLIPLTRFEIDHAVHKDDIKFIMTGACAYDLMAKEVIANFAGIPPTTPLSDVHRPTLAFVQKKRAEAVSFSPNGTGGLKVEAHDDPVPKQLIRNLAAATYDPSKDTDPSDLARGLRRVNEFAVGAADWAPMTTAFASWLEVKGGTRGKLADECISPEHYLLLVETIFDRVRAQYPSDATVRFNPPAAISALSPPAPPALPSEHRLASKFTVTLADKLGGSKADQLRAVRAARANMKARITDPFELQFEEEADAATLLAADHATLSDTDHQRMVRAFERRTLVAARQLRWQQGIELILFYGGTLFMGEENVVEEACVTAIANWFAVAATNLVNPGGMFAAAHYELYPSHGLAVSFSAKLSIQEALGGGLPLDEVDPQQLAGSFVPNLVAKYLHLISLGSRIGLSNHVEQAFNVTRWKYGLI